MESRVRKGLSLCGRSWVRARVVGRENSLIFSRDAMGWSEGATYTYKFAIECWTFWWILPRTKRNYMDESQMIFYAFFCSLFFFVHFTKVYAPVYKDRVYYMIFPVKKHLIRPVIKSKSVCTRAYMKMAKLWKRELTFNNTHTHRQKKTLKLKFYAPVCVLKEDTLRDVYAGNLTKIKQLNACHGCWKYYA